MNEEEGEKEIRGLEEEEEERKEPEKINEGRRRRTRA